MKNFLKISLLSLLLFSTACNDDKELGKLNAIKAVEMAHNYNTSAILDLTSNYDLTQIQNEPYYDYAWHFAYNSNFGEFYGINQEAHIHIEDAWKITRGAGVTIAVIDASNFDWEHEDLKENVIRIYNSDEDSNSISNQGDSDDPSHGSTVAGFISSPINGIGLIGAAPEAKLILIKQIDASDAATIKAFEYAREHGAQIINNSWGTGNVSQGVASAFQELKDDGVTIIFASGNESANMDKIESDGSTIQDESELPSVIGIGASNEYNEHASYSNYGSNIDLVAPGGNLEKGVGILGIDDSGAFGSYIQRSIVSDDYAFTNGTSFSAPITTGVVALMLSVNPSLTPYEVRDILIKTADKIGSSTN